MGSVELGTPKCWAFPAPSVLSCIKGPACGFSPALVLGFILGRCLAMALLGISRPGFVGSCILGFGVLALGSLGVVALGSWI